MTPMPVSPAVSAIVLYVEDEESDVLLMEVAFRKVGLEHALRVVGNGQEAMDYLAGKGAYHDRRRHPLPSVVLLDLNLPLVSGFEFLDWLRRFPGLDALPVVIFSSSSREEDKSKARKLGANDYLEKPNSAVLLTRVVERLRQKWLNAAVSQKDTAVEH